MKIAVPMLKQSMAWKMREIDVFIKHPSLLLNIYKGSAVLASLLMRAELREARKSWATVPSNSLGRTLKVFEAKLWYPSSVLYPLCRWSTPDVVLETGVRNGASTAFILQALKDNGRGRLYSIDLPNVTHRQQGRTKEQKSDHVLGAKSTGFMVPLELRDRWTLILGDARKELPFLVEQLDKIDFFCHDSLHTYEHMYFEYQIAWQKLSAGGILASDDIGSNSAFSDFCKANRIVAHLIGRFGFAFRQQVMVDFEQE